MADAREAFNRFISSVGDKPYPIEEEEPNIIPEDFIQSLNDSIYQNPQRRIMPEDSRESFEAALNPEEDTYRTTLNTKYTLDALENDPEFQARSERFMESIDADEDIYEYLRDTDWSLTSAMLRASQIGDWSDDTKQDYIYLREKFDNASIGGLKQKLQLTKDLTIDILTDPIELLALGLTGATLGASQGTKELAKVAAKQALKKKQKAKLTESILKDAKKPAIYTAIEGAGWAGSHDFFLQQGDVGLGLREELDAAQVGISTTLGGLLGGVMGGSLGLITASSPLLANKLHKFSNEAKIKNEVDSKGKTPKEQVDFLDEEELAERATREADEKDAGKELKKFLDDVAPTWGDKLLAGTVGKQTAYLRRTGNAFEKLGDHLGLFRYDWWRTTTQGLNKAIDKLSFGEQYTRRRSKWHTELGEALSLLNRSGYNEKLSKLSQRYLGIDTYTFYTNKINREQSTHLYYLLSTPNKNWTKKMPNITRKVEIDPVTGKKKTIKYYGQFADTVIDPKTKTAARKLKTILREIAEESGESGTVQLPDGSSYTFDSLLGDTKITDYFPHLLQHQAIKDNQDELLGYLKTHGRKDENGVIIPYAKPNNANSPKLKKKFVDQDTGEITEGFEIVGDPDTVYTVDQVAFGKANSKGKLVPDAELNFEELAKAKLKAEGINSPTPEEVLEEAMNIKGRRIISDILEIKDNPYLPFESETIIGNRFDSRGGGSGRTGWLKERVFSAIPAEKMYAYLDGNVEEVLSDYISNASLLITRNRTFGPSADVYITRHLNPIREQMLAQGADDDLVKDVLERLMKQYTRTAGVEIPTPFGTGRTRNFVDGLRVMQTMAHLPLATVSSLTEPLILLSRVSAGDATATTKDIVVALGKESYKIGERIKNATKRQFGIEHTGTADWADEVWVEAYKVGLSLEQAIQDRMQGLYGETTNKSLQKLTRGFFKTTLLSQWTAAVQLAAFTTGKRLILENIEKLATNRNSFGAPLTKDYREYLEKQLAGLGVDSKRGIKWYNNSLDENGKFNMARGQYGKQKNAEISFYKNDYTMGANRFAREIILNPDVTEANKPIWYTHPAGQILSQFASYPTAFNNTVLKRFAYEMSEDVRLAGKGNMPVATPKILATALLMTGAASLTNIARSQGRSLEKDDSLIVLDAVDRWGGLGPMTYGYRWLENAEFGSGPIGSVSKAAAGPLIQDIVDSYAYRKGLAEFATSNTPYYAALAAASPETAKEWKKIGRDIDKVLFPFPSSEPKPKKSKPFVVGQGRRGGSTVYFAKGGVVKNVPQVPEEPDERVDRITGLPYHMQAGFIGQDEEDRIGFAEGGVVDEKVNDIYSVITKDIRKLAPIYADKEPISTYTKEELKGYNKEPVYRIIKENTVEQDFKDFRDAERIGIHLSTEEPETDETVLKGLLETIRPLDISDMDVPLEGFAFIEEIQNNKELRSKIIDNSILPSETADEYVENLLFHHDLKKQALENNEDIPQIGRILDIVSSHKIRETLKDIGYDSIVYEGESLEPVDQQMEDLGIREPFLAGGLISKLSRRITNLPFKQTRKQLDAGLKTQTSRNYAAGKKGDYFIEGDYIYVLTEEPYEKPTAQILKEDFKAEGYKSEKELKEVFNKFKYDKKDTLFVHKFERYRKTRKAAAAKKTIALDSGQHKVLGDVKQEKIFSKDLLDLEKFKNNKDTLYVFADNEMRGLGAAPKGSDVRKVRYLEGRENIQIPNSIGVRVKRLPNDIERAYWNDFDKNKKLNSRALKRHASKLNEDFGNVVRKYIEGDYKEIVFLDDLKKGKDVNKYQTRMTNNIFNRKLKRTKKYITRYQSTPPDTAKITGSFTPEEVEKFISDKLYGRKYVSPNLIVDPSYKTPIQKSKLGATVADRPRGATARDLGVPEDQALYSKSSPEEIKRLEKRDPVPTEFTDFKDYIKRLEESDSQYETDLAEELKLQWMEDNPKLPFPDDWIPRVIKGSTE